jgi:hypothetical protein
LKLKTLLFFTLILLSVSNLYGGFFGDLFKNTTPSREIIITEEDPIIENIEDVESMDDEVFKPQNQDKNIIVEEEVISADEYIDSVEEPTDIEVFSSQSDSQAFDEEEIFSDEELDDNPYVKSQSIFLSYLDKPEKIYLSEHATIKLKAIIPHENIDSIKTSFLNKKNVTILNLDTPWKKIANNKYENSYIIKAFSTSVIMPDIEITATSSDGKSFKETLKAYKPKIVALREDKEFCLVLSKDFTLKTHHEKKYDEKSNIVVLEISAKNANLEDFHIPYALRDGIDDIEYEGDTQSIYYFAIIPNDIKIFKFKYFDTSSNKYNIVSFPIMLQDSRVSTQTDLNPEESRFELYKLIALVGLAGIFLLFYLKTKKLYLLILALVVGLYVLFTKAPISKILLHKNVKLRILPTKNSTIFYITDQDTKADILLKKDGYIKVLLPNKKIGWIDEDLTKN